MSTWDESSAQGFAVWVTGLPASGKTSLAEEILKRLRSDYGIRMIHLESDALRRVLTPEPTYSYAERDWFYSVMAYFAGLLASNGVPVLIDATANRRAHRDEVRRMVPRFLEVYVNCPLEVCMARDPKGIYAKAQAGGAFTVPGLQDPYEEPETPDVLIQSDKVTPHEGAIPVLEKMKQLGWI